MSRATGSNGPQVDGRDVLTRRTVLRATGLAVGGVLLSRAVAPASAHADEVSPPLSRPAPATATWSPLISLNTYTGRFGRVRIGDDDTRLTLTYPPGAGTVAASRVAAPAYYGLDFSSYPKVSGDSHGTKAASLMQQLFENSYAAFLGFYLAPAPNHPDRSWQAVGAAALIQQGWGLLPLYVGRQQDRLNLIASGTGQAAVQGMQDGLNAASLARAAGVPAGSILYLDMETDRTVASRTFAYIDAWIAKVNADGRYRPGVYALDLQCSVGGKTTSVSNQIRAHVGALPFFVAKNATAPSGSAGSFPLDSNGDEYPLPYVAQPPITVLSQFIGYSRAWQFAQRWRTAPSSGLNAPPAQRKIIYRDTGTPIRLDAYSSELDFDSSTFPDPGSTSGGAPKKNRRASVTAVTLSSSSVVGGSATTITVQLDRAAPSPDGLVVIMRSSAPEARVSTSIRVAAGQAIASTQIHTAPVTSDTSTNLTARALHQLTGGPPSALLTILKG